jgi:predicted metal-dependent phosphoesterase TrpH
MIDLHMHTTYSDGTYATEDLLKEAQNIGLNIISITDHHTVQAYYEIIKNNCYDLFKNKIIVGCEFTTSYKGYTIELLGYGIDLDTINKWSIDYKKRNKIVNKKKIIYSRLVDKAKRLGLTCDLGKYIESNKASDRVVYEELIKHPKNYEILGNDLLKNGSTFYRRGVSNPASKMYIQMSDIDSCITEIINLIHKAGGLVFVAHPHVYKMDDTIKFLESIINDYEIDGIECSHSAASISEMDELIEFCNRHKLYKSGGSDFHRNSKEVHKLGLGSSSDYISENIINDWIDKIKLFKN